MSIEPTSTEARVPDGTRRIDALLLCTHRSAIASNWRSYELLAPALAICSLLVSCITISARKWFWNDELFSYYMLADPSLFHLVRAFHDYIEHHLPLYFLIGWIWARGFGASELSLRLFSSLGVCAACVATWAALRRIYAFWPATLGTLAVFCLANVILYQNAEARMYGMFLASCAAGVCLTCSLSLQNEPRTAALAVNAIVHGVMVLTHLFGLLYSGALLVALLVRDRLAGVFRPSVYLSISVGWLLFLPYFPSFLRQAATAYPRGWVLPPTGKDLIYTLLLSPSRAVQGFVLLLLIAAALRKVGKVVGGQRSEQTRCWQAEMSGIVIASALLAVPVVVWIISRFVKPIFIDRYMIPSTLGSAFLLSHLSASLLGDSTGGVPMPSGSNRRRRSLALWILGGLLLAYPIHVARSLPIEGRPGAKDGEYGHRDLPIVVPFSHDFMKRFFYSAERERYYFILDWQSALDPRSGSFPPGEFKDMDALRRKYPKPFASHVVSGSEFLEKNRRFLVLTFDDYARVCTATDLHCPRWLQTKILASPSYRVEPIGRGDGRTMLLVEKLEGPRT